MTAATRTRKDYRALYEGAAAARDVAQRTACKRARTVARLRTDLRTRRQQLDNLAAENIVQRREIKRLRQELENAETCYQDMLERGEAMRSARRSHANAIRLCRAGNERRLAVMRGMQARITELESECADLCRKLTAAMEESERTARRSQRMNMAPRVMFGS